jgi:hypothetical protein
MTVIRELTDTELGAVCGGGNGHGGNKQIVKDNRFHNVVVWSEVENIIQGNNINGDLEIGED